MSALHLSGVERSEAKVRTKQVLQQLELWTLRNRRASRLSSGQKQRLAIARALAKPTPILIADEPTGNLDPENSAKVIALLKEAARSRLVLIVTHEFDEVKQHATRHVRLQDGAVVIDTVLRPANEAVPAEIVSRKPKRPVSLFVAQLQLRSRPIWACLMVLLFAMTAFSVVAFGGSFVVALDDTNTKYYDSSAFLNGSPNRIVVSSPDFQPLGEKDYARIANLRYVVSLERNGYVTDAQYAYRDGVDYTTTRTEHIFDFGGQVIHDVKVTYEVHKNAPFMQLVPVLPEGQTFLREGRLPESFYEVVAHSDDGLEIGQELTVFLSNRSYWADTAYLQFVFTVVGLTDVGSGLYFADDMGNFCQHLAHTDNSAQYYQILPVQDRGSAYSNIPPEALPEEFTTEMLDDQCQVSSSLMTSKRDEIKYGSLTIGIPNVNLKRQGMDPTSRVNLVYLSTPKMFTVTYVSPTTGKEVTKEIRSFNPHSLTLFPRLIFVSQNTFEQLCWNADSEQVSLTIEDYAYAQRVMEEIESLGYLAASPYRLGSTTVNEEKAAQREQTLTICLIAFLAVVVLQVVVLRAMCGVQTESYRILCNIGLGRKGATWSLIWQLLLFSLVGQALGAAALYMCRQMQIERVVRILRYLPPVLLVLLSLLHLTASMLAAWWAVSSLRKHVYPAAGRFVDLPMDEEVAE